MVDEEDVIVDDDDEVVAFSFLLCVVDVGVASLAGGAVFFFRYSKACVKGMVLS